MVMNSDVSLYLRQWLNTAGTFSIDLAWQTNRMQIRCKCGAILRVDQPVSRDEISWALQEWVVKHGFNGPHDTEPKLPAQVVLAPVPLTADFKRLPNRAKIATGRRFR